MKTSSSSWVFFIQKITAFFQSPFPPKVMVILELISASDGLRLLCFPCPSGQVTASWGRAGLVLCTLVPRPLQQAAKPIHETIGISWVSQWLHSSGWGWKKDAVLPLLGWCYLAKRTTACKCLSLWWRKLQAGGDHDLVDNSLPEQWPFPVLLGMNWEHLSKMRMNKDKAPD